jgi:hypothetical protein
MTDREIRNKRDHIGIENANIDGYYYDPGIGAYRNIYLDMPHPEDIIVHTYWTGPHWDDKR